MHKFITILALFIVACSNTKTTPTLEATIEMVDTTDFALGYGNKTILMPACGFRAKLSDGHIVLFRADGYHSGHDNSRRVCSLLKTGDKIPVILNKQVYKWLLDAQDDNNPNVNF